LEPSPGELDKDDYQSQCFIENFEEYLLEQLRKFRLNTIPGAPSTHGISSLGGSGCLNTVRQRWVDWYKHLSNLDVLQIHDIDKYKMDRLKISQLIINETK
jgi:hypothetical protein